MEAKIEAEKDLKELTAQEHKRIRDQEKEGKKEKKEDRIKKKVGDGETAAAAPAAAAESVMMTERQREAAKLEEEKKEKEKQRREELKRAEFHDQEKELQERLFRSQNKVRYPFFYRYFMRVSTSMMLWDGDGSRIRILELRFYRIWDLIKNVLFT
jgi:hypothetical protein